MNATPITAAFPGDDAWRSAKAKLQRRDRYGRFAEMGGGFSFNLRLGNGELRRVSGKVVGQSGDEDIDIEVKDSDTLADGTYSVPSMKGEAVSAILSKDALKNVKKEKVKKIKDDVFVDVDELKVAKKKKQPKKKQQAEPTKVGTSRSPFKRGEPRTSKSSVKNPKNANLAFADSNGFVEQRSVPIGNKVIDPITGGEVQITSQKKANEFVKNGGALSEVPDDFVLGAIDSNTRPRGRFNVIGTGGGVNGMTRMIDNATGAYIGTKYEVGVSPVWIASYFLPDQIKYAEPVNEMVAEIISEYLGFEPMPMRLVKSKNKDAVSLVTELAHNRWGKIDTPYNPESLDEDYRAINANISSFARMAILDSLIGNVDRNPGNYMIKKTSDGTYELIPIDHSLSMLPNFTGTDQFSPDYMEELEAFRERLRDSKKVDGEMYKEFLDAVGDFIADLADIDPNVLQSKVEQIFDHIEAMFPNEEMYKLAYRSEEMRRMLGTVLQRISYMLGESPENIAELLLSRP